MHLIPNVGTPDRIIRIIVGAVLLILPFVIASPIWTNPVLRYGVLVLGAALIFTALFRFCIPHRPFEVSSRAHGEGA